VSIVPLRELFLEFRNLKLLEKGLNVCQIYNLYGKEKLWTLEQSTLGTVSGAYGYQNMEIDASRMPHVANSDLKSVRKF
jgi:hypothetical protein